VHPAQWCSGTLVGCQSRGLFGRRIRTFRVGSKADRAVIMNSLALDGLSIGSRRVQIGRRCSADLEGCKNLLQRFQRRFSHPSFCRRVSVKCRFDVGSCVFTNAGGDRREDLRMIPHHDRNKHPHGSVERIEPGFGFDSASKGLFPVHAVPVGQRRDPAKDRFQDRVG